MLFSSTYFGNIAFWHEMAKHKTVLFDSAEYYQKQTFRNRTEILTSNGVLALSIPVIRPNGRQSNIEDIVISRAEDWQKDHWKAIESAYKHAPYFWYYGDSIKQLIFSSQDSLILYNKEIILQVAKWLDFNFIYDTSTEKIPLTGKQDFRITLNNKHQTFNHEKYIQVFTEKHPFSCNLSILDALFNIGPLTRKLITA